MTREEFGAAYQTGRDHTVRFLLSRGVNYDMASDVAQGAWLRGWERLDQLRDESALVTWVNTIALNQFRKAIRQAQRFEPLTDMPYPEPILNWAALDLGRIMGRCQSRDRALLNAMLEGLSATELSHKTGGTVIAMRLRLHRARRAARRVAEETDLTRRPLAA